MARKYILIAYRPDHTDYRRGCNMGSSSSDLQVVNSTDDDFISTRIANLLLENQGNRDYAEYEFVLYVDGQHYDVSTSFGVAVDGDYPYDEGAEAEAIRIYNLALEKRNEILLERKRLAEEALIKAEAEKRINKLKAEEEKEQREYEQYLKLRNKYEGVDINE